MPGSVQRVRDHIGDIGCLERLLHAVVHLLGARPVAAEAVEGELGRVDHAGGDLGHPDRLSVQLEPQGVHEHRLARLRRVVAGPAGIGDLRGRRGDEQGVGVTAARADPVAQERQERRRDELRREHVRLEHPAPVVDGAVFDPVDAAGASRDVHERVQIAGGCQVLGERGDVGRTREVGRERGRSHLGIQRGEPLRAARDADDVPPARAERPDHRLADPGTCPRHHSASGRHGSTLPGRADTHCDVTFPRRC